MINFDRQNNLLDYHSYFDFSLLNFMQGWWVYLREKDLEVYSGYRCFGARDHTADLQRQGGGNVGPPQQRRQDRHDRACDARQTERPDRLRRDELRRLPRHGFRVPCAAVERVALQRGSRRV